MTRIAAARITPAARTIADEFALECATCPFAALARELLTASDADLFYWFLDADTVCAQVYYELEYQLAVLEDEAIEFGWF